MEKHLIAHFPRDHFSTWFMETAGFFIVPKFGVCYVCSLRGFYSPHCVFIPYNIRYNCRVFRFSFAQFLGCEVLGAAWFNPGTSL
jgi:hypothetical protein